MTKKLKDILPSFKDRIDLFYVLAFIPLMLVAYFSLVRVVIPIYGFILLLLKRDKLLSFNEPDLTQRGLGVLVLVLSVFAYYLVTLAFPTLADPYGIPNYVIHLIGLFLVFFDLSALKEAFTPIFLIVAATSSFFVSERLEPLLSPTITPLFMRLVETSLKILGLPITSNYGSSILILHTWRGNIPTLFVWDCVGAYSTMMFSIILVVTLVEEESPIRTKLIWATLGIIGTNIVNVIRVITIFLVDYAYGIEVGAQVHYFIGYVLFITWLVLFFVVMAKRPSQKGSERLSHRSSEDDVES